MGRYSDSQSIVLLVMIRILAITFHVWKRANSAAIMIGSEIVRRVERLLLVIMNVLNRLKEWPEIRPSPSGGTHKFWGGLI